MKKGFTLIELLGAIVILGIISVITVPIIQGTIRKSSISSCQKQVISFERAAKNYMTKNVYTLDCDEDGNNTNCNAGAGYDRCRAMCSPTLETLQNEGLLENNALQNPKGGYFDKNSKVKISYVNKTKYTYTYENACTCDDSC